jgi:cyclopropane fatty-acyl-phospholipid synthase-like methyltransferase
MTTGPPDWGTVYDTGTPPPWDIGRPQPVFARLAGSGLLTGRLLDAGCGTGENSLLAAAHGADVTGIDLAGGGIERARRKAAERGLSARFETADALSLGDLGLTFDTIIDSGLFHVFGDEDRARYVAGLAAILRAGGTYYLLCFSDRQPGTEGPRRVSRDEITAAFSDGWAVEDITAEAFETHAGQAPGSPGSSAAAWLATIRRA